MDRLQDFARETESETGDQAAPGAGVCADAGIDAPVVIGTDERRMHVRAYNYWVSLLDGRAYPSVDDIDLDNTSDFGAQSVLLDFTHTGEDPAIAWLGEKLRAECGIPETFSLVSHVPPRSLLSRLHRNS